MVSYRQLRERIGGLIRKGPFWVLAALIVVAGAGSGVAAALGQAIIGGGSVAASQAVLVDVKNFDEKDVGKAAKRAIATVSDDATVATVGAELATGDTLVFDLPLVNMSKNDAKVRASLEVPGILGDKMDVFWNTLTRYTTPSAHASNTPPDPAPVTATTPQSADTISSFAAITGVVDIEEQVSNSSATLDGLAPPSSPGLPSVSPQTRDTFEVNTMPNGSETIVAQSRTVAAFTEVPPGAAPSGAWTEMKKTLQSSGDVGQHSCLAAATQDVLYIAYYNESNESLDFIKSVNGGTTWSTPLSLFSGDEVDSIAMDTADGSIFIAYWADGDLRMHISEDWGCTWKARTVTTTGTANHDISVAAADEDTVFVSYYHGLISWGTLHVARSTDAGDNWDSSVVFVGIPTLTGASGQPSLVAFDEETAYVVYCMSITVPIAPMASLTLSFEVVAASVHIPAAPWETTIWTSSTPLFVYPTLLTIKVLGFIPIPIPLAFVGNFSSIDAIDTDNIFASFSVKASVIHPVTLWFSRSAPYTAGRVFSPALPVDVSGFWNLRHSVTAIDSSHLQMSYYDGIGEQLKLAESDNGGFTWDSTVVDSAGDVGSYNSIAHVQDTSLFTFISYYDSDNGNLKFYAKTTGPQRYYSDTFDVDWDADGVLESLYFVLTDLDADGDIDRIDLSHDGTFGEGSVCPEQGETHDFRTDTGNDERFDADFGYTSTSRDVRFGPYLFTVKFNHSPAGGAFASITSKSWFPGNFVIDLDVDAVSDEPVYFVLSDTNSNGLYDTMELDGDDIYVFGEGDLGDQITGDDDDLNNDERMGRVADELGFTISEAVRLGRYYTFDVAWDTNPAASLPDVNDARITALTRFEGIFDFDVDADGSLTTGGANIVRYALSDTNSDGIYEIMDLSSPDNTFNESAPADLIDANVVPSNDEQIVATTIAAPGVVERSVPTTMGSPLTVDMTSAIRDMWFGPAFKVTVTFDPNPPADLSDATDLTLNRYPSQPGWTIDADGDEAADDLVTFVLSDTESNGVPDVIDISIGDQVYGEGIITSRDAPLSDGVVDFSASDNTNDERIAYADFPYVTRLGLHYFRVEADTAVLADAQDGHISSCWYVGTFPVDVDNDLADNEIDFVQVDPNSDGLYTVFELDGDDSNSYDASEVHTSSNILVDMIGHRVRLFYRPNPSIVDSAVLRDGEILQIVPTGEHEWTFIVPAAAKPDKEQSQIRVIIEMPPEAPPGYYEARVTLKQVR